ncbi:hypothetical protein CY34DRAFT_365796 [Suillus luteus UH-Slu-Lm8-n1]|uniref:Uncharacterized protein n=1 Tax=Suillus luteus UH-Slu-Lm8-n1 TaxID=930992 RepID=A0A0C9ZMQ9_9AGAM|nr:hypothetical protein CY34DRAFT_365796 [Suillus luteus UH-Slu-Lm8-n1]
MSRYLTQIYEYGWPHSEDLTLDPHIPTFDSSYHFVTLSHCHLLLRCQFSSRFGPSIWCSHTSVYRALGNMRDLSHEPPPSTVPISLPPFPPPTHSVHHSGQLRSSYCSICWQLSCFYMHLHHDGSRVPAKK